MLIFFKLSPITNKVFTASSHIVAIATSGNVYSYAAIEELNIKPKNMLDLIDGTPFKKSDVITLQDPQNPEIMAKRDINNFKHLEQVRSDAAEDRKSESKLRHTVASEGVMREIEKAKAAEKESGQSKRTTEDILRGITNDIPDDVRKISDLRPTTEDVNPGQVNTDGRASMSFTSTASNSHTSNATRLATPEEIREARWKILKSVSLFNQIALFESLSFSFTFSFSWEKRHMYNCRRTMEISI
jgi:peptidyl-prolyl cis-trans isomerase-like protein 2